MLHIRTSCPIWGFSDAAPHFSTYLRLKGSVTEGLTFLLVQWGQDAVVSAHLEVNLLLHALRDCTLWNDDADAGLDGAQDPSVAVENSSSGGHHRVPFILVIIVQRTGAEGQRQTSQRQTNQSKEAAANLLWTNCVSFRLSESSVMRTSYLTGMALGMALMLLCWYLGLLSMVRVKVSRPLSWSMGCGDNWGFPVLLLTMLGLLRRSVFTCVSLGRRLWLNLGLSNLRSKGLAVLV